MPWMSREELFNAAWDRPLTTVAAELGVTSTALKKTCDRHDIPTPGRGYWAQVAAGRTFPRPKLRPVKDSRLEQVGIMGVPALPAPVLAARTEAREKVLAAKPAKAMLAVDAAPVLAEVEALDEPTVLAATRKAWVRARPSSAGFLHIKGKGVVAATLGEQSVERGLRFLVRLVQAAERQGHVVQPTEIGVVLEVEGEPLGFRVDEKPLETLHQPTAKELADKARQTWRTSDPWPKYDRAPSSDLSFVIEGANYSGLRRTFSDGKTARIEDKLNDILVAFAAHSAFIKERRRQREEQDRKWADHAARQEREKAFEQREERRGQFVDLVATTLEERRKLAAVLAHIEAAARMEEGRLDAMAAWLRRKIAETDALLGAGFLDISARFAKVDFDEAKAAAGPAEPSWSYPREIELQLWRIDLENDQATSITALEWSRLSAVPGEVLADAP